MVGITIERYLPVLTAQRRLYTAQQSLTTARLTHLTDLVDLYRALGGGWLEHSSEHERLADAS